jgi:hypothetical protein
MNTPLKLKQSLFPFTISNDRFLVTKFRHSILFLLQSNQTINKEKKAKETLKYNSQDFANKKQRLNSIIISLAMLKLVRNQGQKVNAMIIFSCTF